VGSTVQTEPTTRRVFFALWPSDATREALEHATRKAVKGSGGRHEPTENLHATLLFVGPVPTAQLGALETAANTVEVRPFDLVFDEMEHWPKSGVLCATASIQPDAAGALAAALSRNVMRAGFAPDIKPFRAHVTVARKVVKPHALGAIHPVRWRIEGFSLVESQTLPQGSRYTVVRNW